MKLHQNQHFQRKRRFCWNFWLAVKEGFLPYYFKFISRYNSSKLGSGGCGMTHLPSCSPPDCGSAGTSILPTIFPLSSSGNLTRKLPPVQKIFGVLSLKPLENWSRNNNYYTAPLSYCLSYLFLNMLNLPRIFCFDTKYLHISSSVKECMCLFLILNSF